MSHFKISLMRVIAIRVPMLSVIILYVKLIKYRFTFKAPKVHFCVLNYLLIAIKFDIRRHFPEWRASNVFFIQGPVL
jgi:hypothetical protein